MARARANRPRAPSRAPGATRVPQSPSGGLPVPSSPSAARARAPAAAASSAPASSGHPSSSFLPHQMRESPGYAPVPLAAAPVACNADAVAS